MTTPMCPSVHLIEEHMQKFDQWVKAYGYRVPTRADLVPGAVLFMIDIEQYTNFRNQNISSDIIFTTKIKLDDEPIAPSNANPNKEVVFYHCMMPPWDGQCFIPLDDFCASGYREGCYANDTRYVIKA